MNLTIAHRDSPLDESYLRDVSTFVVEGQELIVLFNDGRRRNYPLANLRWYGEVTSDEHNTRFVGMMDPAEPLSPLDFIIDGDDAHEYNHPTPTKEL